MNKKLIHVIVIATLVAVSCVPARKYQDLEARYQEYAETNEDLRKENETMQARNSELSDRVNNLQRQVELLRQDTARLNSNIRQLTRNYEQLNRTYELVQEQNERLLAGRTEETQMILTRLQATQEDLQRREDELRVASQRLNEKEENLNTLLAEVRQKELRVNELEAILARQDSAVQALRRTVSNALLGFENNGLTIDIRQGKVYVSLEESLLFASGSAAVDSRGESALRELARVLERNPEINVLIEGHTDDVPLRPGAQFRDNWDLSVMRATAIVRILLKHGSIEPQRLTAAGRGEYMPIDPAKTPDARRKNRRTEIILTPRLDDLFQILETN
jgi:chemotaxis protein MotB